jgi:hypothetical protein
VKHGGCKKECHARKKKNNHERELNGLKPVGACSLCLCVYGKNTGRVDKFVLEDDPKKPGTWSVPPGVCGFVYCDKKWLARCSC